MDIYFGFPELIQLILNYHMISIKHKTCGGSTELSQIVRSRMACLALKVAGLFIGTFEIHDQQSHVVRREDPETQHIVQS